MSTFHESPDGFLMCLKGAPESLLHRATKVLTAGGERPLTGDDRRQIIDRGGPEWPMRPCGSWVWPIAG